MNKLKNLFMLLVALATIGITLMSYTSILKKKKVAWEPSGCYRPDMTVKYRCGSVDSELTSTSSCIFAKDFESGAHIFDINPNDYIPLANVPVECFGGQTFCCATVISDQTWWGNLEAPCVDQPYFTLEGLYNQYEIDQVYCKID